MNRLVVDLSPMAINRTAMYYVVRDSVRHLLQRFPFCELIACGVPVDTAEFVAGDYTLPHAVERSVSETLGRFLGDPRAASDAVQDVLSPGVTIVFDPLYLALTPWTSQVVVYVLDLTPVTNPTWHDARVSSAYAHAFSLLYRSSVKVVAISESTRRDLWANYGLPPSTITTIPLYDRFAGSERLDRRSVERKFLFVGSLEDRKNVRGLVAAFEASGLAESGYVLHVVGRDGTGAIETRRFASRVAGVHLRGALSDDQLEHEYATCCALVYPSFWEGFGLPALEAINRGLPCVLSMTGALPEIGGDAAVYVDPCSIESIKGGLLEVAARPAPRSEVALPLAKFTIAAYTKTFDEIVDAELARVVPAKDASTDGAPQAFRDDLSPEPIGRRERWKREAIATLLRLRIMNATMGHGVPDPLSADYLYGLQQEKRLNLARALAALRVTRLREWPRLWFSIVLRYFVLLLTNAYVRSHVNEMTLLHLASRPSERDGG